MKEEIRELISESAIMKRCDEIADKINKDFEGESVYLLCILKGSMFFTCEIAKRLKMPVEMGCVNLSSYGDRMTSSGTVTIKDDTDIENIDGKNVIVVEDIVDTGRTVSFLMHMLAKRGPKVLKLCSMLDKPAARVVQVDIDYLGFEVEDVYIVGFGLDYAQNYRNLKYIGELVISEGGK